jgi:hypothetical protein
VAEDVADAGRADHREIHALGPVAVRPGYGWVRFG